MGKDYAFGRTQSTVVAEGLVAALEARNAPSPRPATAPLAPPLATAGRAETDLLPSTRQRQLRQAQERRQRWLIAGSGVVAVAALGLFAWLLGGTVSPSRLTQLSKGPPANIPPPAGPPGTPLSPQALVQQPPTLAGVKSWTLETATNRGQIMVAVSPDGRWFASSAKDGTVRVHAFATGQLVRALLGHDETGSLNRDFSNAALAFSPDSRILLAVDNYNEWWFWDVESGRLLRSLRINSTTSKPAWAPDGRTIAVGRNASVVQIDPITGNEVGTLVTTQGQNVLLIAWAADGKTLAVANQLGAVGLWNLGTGRLLQEMEGPGKNAIGLGRCPFSYGNF